MPVIPTSEGRLIEVQEGVLRLPPPPKVTPVIKRDPTPTHKAIAERVRLQNDLPGYREWFRWRLNQIMDRLEKGRGRHLGSRPGARWKKTSVEWVQAQVQARKDIENMKKSGVDLDSRAEEALESAITVMRAPASQQMKLAAAKLVLEYTKAKPASESKVTVNAAEAWLASLAEDNDDSEADS